MSAGDPGDEAEGMENEQEASFDAEALGEHPVSRLEQSGDTRLTAPGRSNG